MMATLLPQALPALPMGCHETESETSPNLNLPSNTAARNKGARRFPQNFPGCLPILPYTSSEWAKAIVDVKREYVNHRYRPCVSRCTEILDNLRDASTVKPAYLIYLHFYAASAQEMMSRGLHHASTARVNFLHQARDHYLKASHLIATVDAADAAMSQSLLHYSASTIVYDYDFGDSPTSILSSQPEDMWSPSMPSRGPSPASSRSSMDGSLSQAKSSKRSSNSYSRHSVRPDSPTLGLAPAGSTFQDLLDAMPSPPPTTPGLDPGHTQAEPAAPAAPAAPVELVDGPLHNADAMHRSFALLSGLQRQISRHLSFIETDLAAARNPPPTATNLGLHDEEHRALDLQARIERLRASGWQRRRFDFQRYEQLREKALADMME
ncbi:hypothetical protein G7Z17_g6412 [Cylindrodendrum hubeiense]|uniref:Uncharacterized protein n=1 Tax=Cylindrodendrum hubeiense TaxID=595255 RepID=A0A9P5H945_9HYPO|nr:hypothetical protein G7Z17_g6412 [Cylindrodendrum hubeiense]